MKNLMMGQVTVNVSSVTEVNLHQDSIVHARLVVTLPTGQEVELSVNEILELDLQAFDPITGYQIENTDLTL